MNTALKMLVPLTLLGAALSGCSFGRGQGTVSLGFDGGSRSALPRSVARAAVPAPVVITLGSGQLTLTEAKIGIKEIEFEIDLDALPESEKDAFTTDEWEFVGPYQIDLLAGTITPPLGEVLLPAGPYEEIELKLDACLAGGQSIRIAGKWDPDGAGPLTVQDISMNYPGSHEIDLKLPNEKVQLMDINEATNQILIAFRINEWFTGITMADMSNPASIALFVKNFIKSVDYGEDLNGDGILSEAEDDDL